MADYESLFPGRFIKSADLQGKDVTLTIKSVKAEEIDDKMKAVIAFENTKKQMVMNRTNAEAIKLCFGRELDNWVGKRITIYPAAMKDPFGDGEITALRVRGSPDITKPASAEVKRGRKTLKVSVVPTGKPAAKPSSNGKPAVKSNEPSEEEKAAAIAAEYQQAADEGLPT